MTRTQLKRGIWILIADGEKALFLRNEGNVAHPNFEVVRDMKEENPPTREQGSDQPGRHLNDVFGSKSGYEETDWHRIGKERFAEEIAAQLYQFAHKRQFEKIILVAPPLVLGTLRKTLHKEVAERVVDEIAKTLTNHALWDIEKILNPRAGKTGQAAL